MPSLSFILPHWLYWGGLAVFPLLAMYLVRREARTGPGSGITLPIAFMFWLTSGFAGIHRFYLRSWWGLVYIPLFIAILLGNVQVRSAREDVSNGGGEIKSAQFDMQFAKEAVDKGKEGAQAKLEAAQAKLAKAQADNAKDQARYDFWYGTVRTIAVIIAVLLLIDLVLLPRLVRRCREAEARAGPPPAAAPMPEPQEAGTHEAPALSVHNRFTDWVDWADGYVGEYVSYWSIIAVFVYYYEVLARYVFNSPTDWAHEGMFLMFGMQYLLSGAFALREDSHVRVDVIYVMLPKRVQAFLDVVTSIFFYLFNVTLFVTGMIFAMNAISLWEKSFTEWEIQYWPVKLTMPLGALLILIQGTVKLLKDFTILTRKEA